MTFSISSRLIASVRQVTVGYLVLQVRSGGENKRLVADVWDSFKRQLEVNQI